MDDPPIPPKPDKSRLGFQTIGSISAIVVAVASLFVAWDEANSVRRQQAASVLPILKIQTPFTNDASERSYRIVVSNVGVGPAFIDTGTVLWDGEVVKTVEELRFNVADVTGEASFWTSELEGQVLGGGESLLLYEVEWEPEREGASRAAVETVSHLRESVSVTACYCSVYDRCWTTGINRLGRPEPVSICPKT